MTHMCRILIISTAFITLWAALEITRPTERLAQWAWENGK